MTEDPFGDNEETVVTLLNAGDAFPKLTLTQPGGKSMVLPDAFAGSFAVVLFFRGSWCPYCNTQLRAFQRSSDRLAEAGVKVAALSSDDETATATLITDLGLTFPVGHSADPTAVSAATGAFVNSDPAYLQSTGFLLDPSGNVVVSVYSSGAIGRLMPDDVTGMVRYVSGSAGH
ncbi:peroxiredoxin family protein [Nocardioides sp. YIM 152315]|uniref:peroxiredoxin family protein n=1 Tax=Nocardioides sp. YIM 152315 TaxID=3031760 RepID=UPI0023DB5BFC|nr:peroxiredoxin family protein [Nocardioides sp. YIM 152315]MDF1603207.1 peroxiredoxin family protein [Nocardioides sp. YIM 152315]